MIEKDGKYLLVQEAKEKCYGKWNLPAGHLEPNESIIAGAIREAREETGCNVEPTGICQIGNRVSENNLLVEVVFTAKLIHETITFDKTEILDVKWFTYEEILSMRDKIRNEKLIIDAIDSVRKGIIAPLEIISQYE